MASKDKEETQRMIEVMQAYVDGEEIESCLKGTNNWHPTNKPTWSWHEQYYRIKDEFGDTIIDEIETTIYQTEDGVKHFTWEEACKHVKLLKDDTLGEEINNDT